MCVLYRVVIASCDYPVRTDRVRPRLPQRRRAGSVAGVFDDPRPAKARRRRICCPGVWYLIEPGRVDPGSRSTAHHDRGFQHHRAGDRLPSRPPTTTPCGTSSRHSTSTGRLASGRVWLAVARALTPDQSGPASIALWNNVRQVPCDVTVRLLNRPARRPAGICQAARLCCGDLAHSSTTKDKRMAWASDMRQHQLLRPNQAAAQLPASALGL